MLGALPPIPSVMAEITNWCSWELDRTMVKWCVLGVNRIPISTKLEHTVNHRLNVLVAGLALATAGMAGCSSTTAGPTGAIQDAATASATSEASVAPVSPPPTSPAPEMLGSSSNPVSNNVCDTGLQYSCGDPGPGGGIVFYATATSFPCEANLSSTCNFLEAAPNGWNGKEVKCPNGCDGTYYNGIGGTTSDFGAAGAGTGTGSAYCSGMGEHHPIPSANSTAIGTGYQNTTSMVQNCVTNNAGNAARAYSGGGMTDWSLPSAGELAALQNAPNVQSIGGISGAYYWSSTQASGSENANMMQFQNAIWSTDPKSSSHGVRPVRTF